MSGITQFRVFESLKEAGVLLPKKPDGKFFTVKALKKLKFDLKFEGDEFVGYEISGMQCSVCKIFKKADLFYKNFTYATGYQSRCKNCKKNLHSGKNYANRKKDINKTLMEKYDNILDLENLQGIIKETLIELLKEVKGE